MKPYHRPKKLFYLNTFLVICIAIYWFAKEDEVTRHIDGKVFHGPNGLNVTDLNTGDTQRLVDDDSLVLKDIKPLGPRALLLSTIRLSQSTQLATFDISSSRKQLIGEGRLGTPLPNSPFGAYVVGKSDVIVQNLQNDFSYSWTESKYIWAVTAISEHQLLTAHYGDNNGAVLTLYDITDNSATELKNFSDCLVSTMVWAAARKRLYCRKAEKEYPDTVILEKDLAGNTHKEIHIGRGFFLEQYVEKEDALLFSRGRWNWDWSKSGETYDLWLHNLKTDKLELIAKEIWPPYAYMPT